MRLHANHVSIDESGGEFFQISFDSEARDEDDFDLSEPDHPYLLVQRQFEDDDGGVCYIETHDHDTYAGHYRLRLIEVTPTRLAFEIARNENKYVEVTYDLDAKRFDEVQRIAVAEEPIIYLVNPDYLTAVSPTLHGLAPSTAPPQLLWNIEWLRLE